MHNRSMSLIIVFKDQLKPASLIFSIEKLPNCIKKILSFQTLPDENDDSSLSLWFKTGPSDHVRTLMSWANGNASNARSIGLSADNQLTASVLASNPLSCAIPTLDPDQWQLVTFEFSASIKLIFVEGLNGFG